MARVQHAEEYDQQQQQEPGAHPRSRPSTSSSARRGPSGASAPVSPTSPISPARKQGLLNRLFGSFGSRVEWDKRRGAEKDAPPEKAERSVEQPAVDSGGRKLVRRNTSNHTGSFGRRTMEK
jgi:hypothetical protein